jgi:hypothetical protein
MLKLTKGQTEGPKYKLVGFGAAARRARGFNSFAFILKCIEHPCLAIFSKWHKYS